MSKSKKPVRGKSGKSIAELVPMSQDARREVMMQVAGEMPLWKPARQVLRRVRALPTIFPSFDRGTRCGGVPLDRAITIHGPSNQGKAQPLWSKVLTPKGWVTMGSLEVNDRVIGSDGLAHDIIGVFPQGQKEIFEIMMSDGSRTTCSREHLWLTETAEERSKHLGPSAKSLDEIMKTFNQEHHIPFIAGVDRTKPRMMKRISARGFDECQCIAVDTPDHLYVTDDEILTHNSLFTLGLVLSFLRSNNFALYVDTECTTPITWCEKLMAAYADHPGYLALRPSCMEEAVEATQQFSTRIQKLREAGTLPQDICYIEVLDSLRKLVPRDLMAHVLMKDGIEKYGMDGMRGRGAQHRANAVAQWLDSLVPILHSTGGTVAMVARESDNPEATPDDRKYHRRNAYRVQGGGSIIYDASLVARISRDKWVMHGTGSDARVIGERIHVQIWKTKVAGKEDDVIETYFHTSNGTFAPEGFDRARDVLEIAREMQIITGDGWYSYQGQRLGQGENQSVKRLGENPELLTEIEGRIRGGFVVDGENPEQEDEELAPPPRRKKVVA